MRRESIELALWFGAAVVVNPDQAMKVTAVLLYVSGLSMNRTAKLLDVSTPNVMAWIEQFAAAYGQKPEPEGRALVIELDEMCGTISKKDQQALDLEGSGSCFRPAG